MKPIKIKSLDEFVKKICKLRICNLNELKKNICITQKCNFDEIKKIFAIQICNLDKIEKISKIQECYLDEFTKKIYEIQKCNLDEFVKKIYEIQKCNLDEFVNKIYEIQKCNLDEFVNKISETQKCNLDEFVKNTCDMQKCKFEEFVEKGIFVKGKHLFRGQPNIGYDLSPAIQRYITSLKYNDESWFMERNLIEMAKIRFPNIFTNDLQPIELLSLLQHYGIPTRLLDVTENALVALYFACKSDFDKNGEVIVFLPEEFNIANSPLANGIADSYRFLNNGCCNLNIFYKRIIEQPYFWEQKNVHQKKENDNNELSGAEWIEIICKSKVFFVNAPFRTLRQQIQCGRYILFPNLIKNSKKLGLCFESKIEPLPKNDKSIIKRRICIPADKKEQILKDLKTFGISEGVLFGDSVDKVCKEIKDSFK